LGRALGPWPFGWLLGLGRRRRRQGAFGLTHNFAWPFNAFAAFGTRGLFALFSGLFVGRGLIHLLFTWFPLAFTARAFTRLALLIGFAGIWRLALDCGPRTLSFRFGHGRWHIERLRCARFLGPFSLGALDGRSGYRRFRQAHARWPVESTLGAPFGCLSGDGLNLLSLRALGL